MSRITRISVLAGMAVSMSAALVLGATGDVLIEYRADSGVTPEASGWQHEGRCLKSSCPDSDPYGDCYWQGGISGNVCGPNVGYGCNTDEIHFNFPAEPQPSGTCTYTEWVEFDDDGANLEHPDTNSQHPKTPKGASNFPFAPAYEALRLVGGDGNGVAASLPANSSANRNEGKIKVRKDHGHVGIVTLVFRGAMAERGTPDRASRCLAIRTTDGTDEVRFEFFHFTDNALEPGPDIGKFGWVNDGSGDNALIDGLGTVPPQQFFTIRIVCDPFQKNAEIWLNEDNAPELGYIESIPGFIPEVRTGSTGTNTQFGLIESGDITVWVDYFQVLEGRVPPNLDPCAIYDPVFDATGISGTPDGYVDEQDYGYFNSMCATGPAPDVAVFEALSPRCMCMDRNNDMAVDQDDFGKFQVCYTGSAVSGGSPVDNSCDDREWVQE